MGKTERISRLRALIERLDLDGVLVTSSSNVRYISGFTGSEGTCLVTKKEAMFFTDSRYTIQAGDETEGFEVHTFLEKAPYISEHIRKLGLTRLGMESVYMPYGEWRNYSEAFKPIEIAPLQKEIDHLRMIKEPEEIELIREAIAISEKAFLKAVAQIKPGAVEKDVALTLEFEQKRSGASGVPFEIIIASGYRGALPHGIASDKKIEKGEMVVIDFGAVYQGYCSDQTCTLGVGAIDDEAREIYRIVLDAQRKAIDAAKPGMDVVDLDKTARDHIEAKGYGKLFGHGLGHGLGLDVHEDPRISRLGKGVIEKGMIFSIEPGIYIEGRLGIRIEDLVLATDHGVEVLTTLDKRLTVI